MHKILHMQQDLKFSVRKYMSEGRREKTRNAEWEACLIEYFALLSPI